MLEKYDLYLIKLAYEQIISNIITLFQRLGISSDVEAIFIFLKYMINNGYLTIKTDPINNLEDIENAFFKINKAGMLLFIDSPNCRHKTNFANCVYRALGYSSSQLFTYAPWLCINVNVYDNYPISIFQIQSICDDIIQKHFNLFASEDQSYFYKGPKIDITLEFHKAKDAYIRIGNHTINIVIDQRQIAHIFDITKGFIGIKADEDDLLLHMYQPEGFRHYQFIKKAAYAKKDMGTSFFVNALNLLEKYPSLDIKTQLAENALLEKECPKYASDFQTFFEQNSQSYDVIYKRVRKLSQKYLPKT